MKVPEEMCEAFNRALDNYCHDPECCQQQEKYEWLKQQLEAAFALLPPIELPPQAEDYRVTPDLVMRSSLVKQAIEAAGYRWEES